MLIVLAGAILGMFIASWMLVVQFYLRHRNIKRYVTRQVNRYPFMSIENRIYSDLLTVMALDGVAEDRNFGSESK